MRNDSTLTRYSEEVHAIYMIRFRADPNRYAYYAMPVMSWYTTTNNETFAEVAAPDGGIVMASTMAKTLLRLHDSLLSEVTLVAVDRLSRWDRCPHLLPPYRLIPGTDDVGGYDPNRHDRRP